MIFLQHFTKVFDNGKISKFEVLPVIKILALLLNLSSNNFVFRTGSMLSLLLCSTWFLKFTNGNLGIFVLTLFWILFCLTKIYCFSLCYGLATHWGQWHFSRLLWKNYAKFNIKEFRIKRNLYWIQITLNIIRHVIFLICNLLVTTNLDGKGHL